MRDNAPHAAKTAGTLSTMDRYHVGKLTHYDGRIMRHAEKRFGVLSCRSFQIETKTEIRLNPLVWEAWLARLPAAELVGFVCWPEELFTLRQPGAMCFIS